MNLSPMRSISVAVLLTVTLVLALPSLIGRASMKAATCVTNPVVITNADSGAGSLRQAILDACDGSTITFANTVASPITLASELAVDKNLTIQGPGANLLTISGNNAVRVFNIGSVNPAINVTLTGLTIANGSATLIGVGFDTKSIGGGILNNSTGTLTLTDSVISGNSATAAANNSIGGGGIANANSGTVNVLNTTISGNSTQFANAGLGGGIYNFGTGVVNVANSILMNNNARGGGGISNFIGGTLNMTNSTLSGNSTNREMDPGGGIFNFGGTATITGSTFSGNTAAGGFGGAIDNIFFGSVTVSGCQFSGNSILGTSGSGGGAAIGNEESMLMVTNCTFSNNMGGGAGVVNSQGTVAIANSTFSSNNANGQGGVIFNDTSSLSGDTLLTITNCTFSGNAGFRLTREVTFGCILNFGGPADIINCTLSGNDSGIANQFGTTNVKNTVVASN
ncbi:MAG TPA: hypothetical protein VN345_06990, partial [Blastocatellia bacterium]|nr:hypothetical protein [Blastocatellia bacterium]